MKSKSMEGLLIRATKLVAFVPVAGMVLWLGIAIGQLLLTKVLVQMPALFSNKYLMTALLCGLYLLVGPLETKLVWKKPWEDTDKLRKLPPLLTILFCGILAPFYVEGIPLVYRIPG
jgi:hypothetical protein